MTDMKKYFLFCLLFVFSFVYCQTDTTRKYRLTLSVDSRNSFIKGQKALTRGAKMGFKKDGLSVGMAGYGLVNPIKKQTTFENLSHIEIEGNVELGFVYYTTWIEYAWIESKRWEFTTAYHLGLGIIQISYFPYDLSIIPPQKKLLGLNEIFLSLIFRPHRYLGLGAGAGIRNAITAKKFISQSFDSPLYQFRIKLYTSEIFKDIKGLINKKYQNIH